ncbi:MAG TPA: imidazolonepropionase [Candidatus Dormibacteraeota bacterium]|nr:imidazolonepropionase [Candidatus Dormibacteraeota bacterium]
MRRLRRIGRLFTGGDAGVISNASVIFDGPRIAWRGRSGDEPRDLVRAVTHDEDCAGGLVTAGLIDAHTHPHYAGNRMAEVAMRTSGATYSEIAEAGGGIVATVKATRAASERALQNATAARLKRWFAGGATTVETKTGYFLNRSGELHSAASLRRLSTRRNLPSLEVTFLGAHALPPDGRLTFDEYAARVAQWSKAAKAAGARFCDVFCDQGYFSVEQTRVIMKAAISAQLIPRVHADELARTGGSQLAAEVGAASADHLLCATIDDARALARAGVVATLAPVTALSMGKLPPVKELQSAGATIALGTDHNPGTSGLTSMSVVIALAIAVFKMSVTDALVAATAGGARSLRLSDRGKVDPGLRADVVLWDADHEGALAWTFGLAPRQVWKGGVPIA